MRFIQTSLCLLLLASAALAQSDRGTITGTVTDSTGAVIANAQIQAKQAETGALFPTVSTDTGNYTLVQLPVGPYEISVTVPGFKKFVRSGITVEAAQVQRVDIPLQLGAETESVTVSAEGSLLKTETGDVSQNVQVQSLDQLPMLGTGSANAGSSGIRNPNNVLNVVPGVYYVPNSQVKINGAQSNSYAYHVDGMDATNAGFPYAAAQTQPGVDAIQEVAVQTSNFAPEFGAVGGGFFNVTMKSGGNQFHGTGYDYFVNEVLNAGTPFTSQTQTDSTRSGLIRPRARRNDYGGTIGGPVIIPKLYNGKDKTFFFFSFEQFRETQIINNTPITVPTLAYRNGDFSQAEKQAGNVLLTSGGKPVVDATGAPVMVGEIFQPGTGIPYTNNIIPTSQLNPIALNIQSLIPLPQTGLTKDNYIPTYPALRHTTIPSVKIDQVLSSKAKLSFYWSQTGTVAPLSPIYGNSEGLPSPITESRGSYIHSHVERLNYDYTISPTLLLHIGAGYQQNNFFDDAPTINYNASAAPPVGIGLSGATINRNFPIFNGLCSETTDCTAAGGTYNMGPPGQGHSYWEKPGGNASLTWVRNSHTLKAGFDGYWSAVPQTPFTNTAGAYTFSGNETGVPGLVGTTLSGGTQGLPYASFLLGQVDQFTLAQLADYRESKVQLGFFLQDSWKVTRKLTLDYGVRYDYGTAYHEEHDRAVSFFPNAQNQAIPTEKGAFLYAGSGPGGCNCTFANAYPYAIGPRIGAAYSLDDKTVLRMGWGLIYGATSVNPLGVNSPGILATNSITSPGLGQAVMTLGGPLPVAVPSFPSQVLPQSLTGGQVVPGVNFFDPGAGRPPRQNQWSIGIQRELSKDLVVEASYVGNRGVWWQAPSLLDINAVTPSILAAHGLSLSDPNTITLLSSQLSKVAPATLAQYNIGVPYAGFATSNTVGQALRPFPQFANIPASGDPLGKTWYDSLQTKLTKRFSHGLTGTATYTWQKSEQVGVDGNANITVPNGSGAPTNYVNNTVLGAQTSKSISLYDQPQVLTIAMSYSLPKVAALGKVGSWLLEDWQVGTLLNYSSGLPIPVPSATTSTGNALFQGVTYERVAGVPLYTVPSLNCACYDPTRTPVLNSAAWVNPAPGQFGGAPFYTDYRYQRHPGENINLGRTWRIKERMSFNLRVEFSNFLNRTYYNNPSATNPTTKATFNPTGALTGGFGYISTVFSSTTQLAQPRNGTIVARFSF
jgi:hypothetical protein